MGLQISEGTATVDLYRNGVATGDSVTVSSGTSATINLNASTTSFADGDILNFVTHSATGNTNGGRVTIWLTATVDPAPGTTIGDLTNVDTTGVQDGQTLIYNNSTGLFEPGEGGGGGASLAAAEGYANILGAQLQAAAGNPALTTQFVLAPAGAPYTGDIAFGSAEDNLNWNCCKTWPTKSTTTTPTLSASGEAELWA